MASLIPLKDEAQRRGMRVIDLRKRCSNGQETLAVKDPRSGRWSFKEASTPARDTDDADIPQDAEKTELDRLAKLWQARKMRAEARIKQAEEARMTGGLVERSSLEQVWAGVLSNVRAQMLAVPASIRRELGADVIDDHAHRAIVQIVDDALLTAMDQ